MTQSATAQDTLVIETAEGNTVIPAAQISKIAFSGTTMTITDTQGQPSAYDVEQVQRVSNKTFHPFGNIQWGDVTQEQREVITRMLSNMVRVEGGTFRMGATPEQEEYAWDNEKPVHNVTLSSYYICKYEMTQKEWRVVTGETVEYTEDTGGVGDDLPTCWISIDDCKLVTSLLKQYTGLNFAIPTEAQWEFAARGGNMSQGYMYSGSNDLDEVAWYGSNTTYSHPVGQKKPNELGLYDMSGNVFEWCADYFGNYTADDQTNPTGPDSGGGYVNRGGNWNYYSSRCRVSFRNFNYPEGEIYGLGLRLAIVE